jgi:Fic family protein
MDFSKYKSGEKVSVDGVNCHVPSEINHDWSWDDGSINLLLSKAGYYLGELNAMMRYLPNAELFYSMSIHKEAIKSNEIEGTKTELEEILEGDEDEVIKFVDVLNYVEAAEFTFQRLGEEKLTEDFLLKVHEIMIRQDKNGVKSRGKYKQVQNWIGGSTKHDARFVPAPPKKVKKAMEDLFDFLNNETYDVPDLIKIGIAHYQFETIHPFDDGNGRVGRLLIPMYLLDKKILKYPLFISHFFAEQRRDYYDNLDRVRSSNDLTHWIKFFLVAIKSSAKRTINIINELDNYKKECESIVKEIYGS